MISTRQWYDILEQQYNLVTDSPGGSDLLRSMRKFVNFLETDPQARRYVKQMEYEWRASNKKWKVNCSVIRSRLFELENRIRAIGAKLDETIGSQKEIPDLEAFNQSKHILDKIKENNWYQPWDTLTDDLNLKLLHLERPRQTQTGHMVSHVLGVARALARLADAVAEEEEIVTDLCGKAESLWRQCGSAQNKAQNDWMSSGIHALKQLKIAVKIMDGDFFVDPGNYSHTEMRSLSTWRLLMVMYAPADLKDEFKWWLKQPDAAITGFEDGLEPLIRSYLRQVFDELSFLANSRLAHQHLIEMYKMRCENYGWKEIEEIIQLHAERIAEKAESTGNRPRHHFEDLLTLHLARYLHDNGYAVHYTQRHGVHEPDLLGNIYHDLEPIVVEAKVVGQQYGTEQGNDWIKEGLRALLAYLQKYLSDYGVTNGYLIVFRMGDETTPMYTFDPLEWVISGFTIVPRVINIGRINKKDPPIVVKLTDFLHEINSGLS